MKRICDPMEKIWIKKELYFEKYEFLKFYTIFSDFIWFLIDFLKYFSIKKIEKKGVGLPRSWRGERAQAGLMWRAGPRGARVHRAVTTWRWGHVAGRVWPARDEWPTRGIYII